MAKKPKLLKVKAEMSGLFGVLFYLDFVFIMIIGDGCFGTQL